MSNNNARLSQGINSLAYMGVNPTTPPQLVKYPRSPLPTDFQNFLLGTIWLVDDTPEVWILVSLSQLNPEGRALWIELTASASGNVSSLVTNSGTATPVAGVINVLGDEIGITASAVGNTITLSLVGGGGAADQFTTNAGFAIPDGAGNLNVFGGSNILTNVTAGPNTVVVGLVNSPSVSGTFTAGTGITTTTGDITAPAGSMSAGQTITAGTGITATTGNITASAGNVSASGSVAAGGALTGATLTVTAAPTFTGLVGPGVVLASAGGLLSVSTPGISGLVLTSTGVSSQPTWQSVGGGGGGTTSFITNTNSPALPTGGGAINIKGDGVVFSTDGTTANTVTVLPGTGAATNGRLLIGGATPTWAVPTCPDGTIVYAFTNGGLSMRATTGGGSGGMLTAHSDAGTDATVTAQALTFAGGGGFIRTSGAGATLTIGQVTNPVITGNVSFSTGTVTVATGNLVATAGNISAGGTISSTGSMTAGNGFTVTTGTTTFGGLVGPGVVLASAGGVLSVSTPGASGFVLTSTGSGSQPTWQASGGGGGGLTAANNGSNTNQTIVGTTLTYNLNNTIHWNATDATHGVIFIGGPGDTYPFMHAYGNDTNAFLGTNAGNFTLTKASAVQNVGIGTNSLDALTTGSNNSGCGHNTLTDCTTGSANSAFGHGALANLVGADDNSAFGSASGQSVTSGTNNCLFGFQSGTAITTGSSNSMYGTQAGALTVTSSSNSFFGYQAGAANTAASNSYFGALSGTVATSAVNNAFFGANSGDSVTTGSQNCLYGRSSGQAITTSSNNSFFGYNSGTANTSGAENSLFGANAGDSITTGSDNSIFGKSAGQAITTQSGNTIMGWEAGNNNVADANTFYGFGAGHDTTSGTNNLYAGYNAADQASTGSNNVILGALAGGAMTGASSNNIVIGYNAASNWT